MVFLMRQILLWVVYFTLLFQSTCLTANASSHTAGLGSSIILSSENRIHSFSGSFQYLVDETGEMELTDVQRHFANGKGKTIAKDNISLGYIRSTIWLKFSINNQMDNFNDWLLIFDYPLLDHVKLFSQYSDEHREQWKVEAFGDKYLFDQRALAYRLFVTPFSLDKNQSINFYVQIQSESSMQIRPYVISAKHFFINELSNEMFYGLIYGIMVLMALYNLFLYIAVRDISYLAYVFSVLTGCIFIMSLNGHAYQYLWPNSIWLANSAIPLFVSLWMASTAVFTQIFLETKAFTPRLYKAINFLITFAIFTAIFTIFGDYQTAIKISTGLAFLNVILILSTSVVCWLRGNRFARFFVAAWAIYGLGTAMLITSRFGVISDNFVTHNSASLGLLVEIIMLSLALSDKYRLMTEQLEQHTVELENKVAERTKALEQSNQKLERQSRHDSLTKLPNRRFFDLQLTQEWERSIRQGKTLSILVIDVDEFKSINDYFGHQYGDDCLLNVSRVIETVLHRPGDFAARFGGDEFVVILPDTDILGAKQKGNEICHAIKQIGIAQAPDCIHSVVTTSIGCASVTPTQESDIKELFSNADAALYKAKERGRDCVA